MNKVNHRAGGFPLPQYASYQAFIDDKPALSFVGRQNSGKTTLLEKIIRTLSERGLSLATIKHHGHPHFDIDIPGKDSYRHHAAGAQTSVVVSDERLALVRDLSAPVGIHELFHTLPEADLVLVEGFRKTVLPSIELFRAENPKDQAAAQGFIEGLSTSQRTYETVPVGVVTNMPQIAEAASKAQIPVFALDDIEGICDHIEQHYARPRLSIALQAGGESRRMGQSKALVEFNGRPLIEHMLARLNPIADDLFITTNEPERLAYLQERYPNLRLVEDVIDRRGALPGFMTACTYAQHEMMALVACDMVFVHTQLLQKQALALFKANYDAIVPVTKNGFEPFSGVYHRDLTKDALQTLLDEGKTKVGMLFERLDYLKLDCHVIRRELHEAGPFLNANTPEELRKMEELLTTPPSPVVAPITKR